MKEKTAKIITYYKKNNIIILSVILVLVVKLYYLYIATENVPIMDYWRYINEITDKVFANNITFDDLWKNSLVHRNPLLYILLIINMKYFGLNTQIEIFSGAIIGAVNCFIIYNIYLNTVLKYLTNNYKIGQILFIIIVTTVFNYNQWEINTLQFSLTFMIRIATFLLIYRMVDNYLHNIETRKHEALKIGIIILLAVCILSQGYFPAMVGTVIFAILLHFIITFKTEGKKYIKYYFIIFISIIASMLLYLNGLTSMTQGDNSIVLFTKSIFNGNFINGVIMMMGGSLISFEFVSKFGGIIIYYIVGTITFIAYAVALIIYFKNKIYKRTYFPIMLIIYAFINIVLIIYGRLSTFDLGYLASSRYTCETTLGLIGILLILIDYFLMLLDNKKNKWTSKITVSFLFTNLLICVIVICLCLSALMEIKTAPYRKIYDQNLIDMLFNIENTTDDELIAFQAYNPEYVRNGAELMKKYQLGVFNNKLDNGKIENKKIKVVGHTLETAEILKGVFSDGWIEKISQFKILTGNEGRVILKGYYPDEITGKEIGKVYINGEKITSFIIKENNFTIELSTKVNSIVTITIENDFDFQAKKPDIRRLSFVLLSVEGK